jgi:nitrite reductase/ring-hydroxylating ferredoxin subunit
MGITHGAIAGMLLGDLICGRSNPWAAIYDPARRSLGTALEFARENLNTAAQYADWLRVGDPKGAERIAPGQAAVIRSGLRLLACYRDPAGVLHVQSARCPHLNGVVRWNSAEHTWDCPCHGSRFGPTGGVLNGPAIRPLTRVEGQRAARAG